MAWPFGKKDEKPVKNKLPEQSERQYNLFWMIRMSPFADRSDEEVQQAIDRKIAEVERTLRTQPVEMVRVKSERKVEKLKALSGDSAEVRVSSFQNDLVSFKSRDDVMTLLIHLGYLAYDQKKQMAYIPNEDIRRWLAEAVIQ